MTFKKNRNTEKMSIDPSEFVTYVVEETTLIPITQFQYQFNSDYKLYEFIIFYDKSFDVFSNFSKRFGNPNSGKEWLFESIDGINIKIWVFEIDFVLQMLRCFSFQKRHS